MKIIYEFAEMFCIGFIGMLTGFMLFFGLLGFLYTVYYTSKSIIKIFNQNK